jgi:hypothetical protein
MERSMLTFLRRSEGTDNPTSQLGTKADHMRQPRLRWENFNICPHCLANGRLILVEGPNEWGPIVSRSDGVNFHLVLGDRPVFYPAKLATGKKQMMSAGFWYVHEANGGSTEAVVVILRRPPRGGTPLLHHLEAVADKLFEKLKKSSRLPCIYAFDGRQLHQIVH